MQAEGRLAARRAARAEAREIRLREIERQQKESDEKEENKTKLSNDYRVSLFSQNVIQSSRVIYIKIAVINVELTV